MMSDPEIRFNFATRMLFSIYENFAQERATLVEAVYEISRQAQLVGHDGTITLDAPLGGTAREPTSTRPEKGEDKRPPNIQEDPRFSNVLAFIKQKAYKLANFLKFDLESFELLMTSVWVNINPRYSFHEDHIHARSHFSGVFYLQCPPNSGPIRFRDPREVSLMLPPHYAEPEVDDRYIRLSPVEGGLLIFPAWLGHSVGPNMSETDRISMSFNFLQQSKAGARPASTVSSGE